MSSSTTLPANTNPSTPIFLLSNISTYVTVKLDHSNFLTWKFQITHILEAYSLLEYVEGYNTCPPKFLADELGAITTQVNSVYSQWQARDKALMSLISATLSSSAHSLIIGQTSAYGMWNVLLKRYTSVSRSNILNLKKQLHDVKKNTDTVAQYLQRIKESKDRLATVGTLVDDEDLLHIVLKGLPSEYESFSTAMLTKSEPVSFEELHVLMITQEELLKNSQENSIMAMAANKGSSSPAQFNNSAYRGNFQNRGRGSWNSRGRSHNRGGFSSRGGYNPGINQVSNGFPQSFSQSNPNFSPSNPNFSQSQSNPNFSNPNPNRPTCQICYKQGHTALDCYNQMNFSYQGRHPPAKLAAIASAAPPSPSTNCWISDTGATDHFTPDLGNLPDSSIYNDPHLVSVGNGQQLPISHIGNAQLYTSSYLFKLKNILRVPSMASNLLSVNRFCRDNRCAFYFDSDHFRIQDRLTGKHLYKGLSRDGLYPLHGLSLPFNTRQSLSSSSARVACLHSARATSSASSLWHARFGHPQDRVLRHVLHKSVNPSLSIKSQFCKHCTQGKMTQLPFSHSNTIASFPLEIVYSDVWGPAPIPSINGFRYYVSFIDAYSRFTWFFPLKHKSQVLSSFMHFKNTMENLLGTTIKIFRTDCGGEYSKNSFQSFCSSHGILHQFTCPHTSQQNGVSERKHRHIVDMALCLISHSSLPYTFWPYAFSTAVYLINHLPSLIRNYVSPWETLFGNSPDYKSFKIFGCACYPLLRSYNSHKFSLRSTQCIFLGYASNAKGYLCLDPNSNRLYTSRHVIFDETTFPFHHVSPTSSPSSTSSTPNPWLSNLLFFQACPHASILGPHPSSLLTNPSILGPHPSTISPHTPNPSHPLSLSNTPHTAHNPFSPFPQTLPEPIEPNEPIIPSALPGPSSQTLTDHIQPNEPLIPPALPDPPLPNPIPSSSSLAPPPSPTNTHPMVTRSKNGISKKKLLHTTTTKPPPDYLQTEPPTHTIASRIPEWTAAMRDEFDALQCQQTWSLVPPPAGHNIIGCRWVYKLKRTSDGSISRYKARLVAKGFHQKPGLDFDETFSPVVKPPTVRIVLSLAAQHQWPLRQLDISNAFLHGFLKEDVFMVQPPGFVHSVYPNHVCKLHKSLYGLKQAPRAWFERFTSHLLTIGFTASTADPSLFVFRQGSTLLYLLLYVDDIILTGNSTAAVNSLITQLAATFELKDLGPLRYFLGLQIDYGTDCLFVHQRKYITDLLSKFNMPTCKAASTPFSISHKLQPSSEAILSDPTQYRSLVGALQYATFTRPDITYAVNQVCQYMHQPTATHFTAAKRILRYLQGTLSLGIRFTSSSSVLTAFTDSDWAGDPLDRRSTTGITVFLGNNPITWISKKQHTVSRSSTKAEYRALASGAAELAWLRQVLCDLGVVLHHAPTMWCDNTSAIALASNPVFHSRTKHIEVDYHFVRERVVRGDLHLQFISTDDQLADLFTKPLSTQCFQRLTSKLMFSTPEH
jgi:hypothetical protein